MNPILKGVRERNRKISKRINSTGHRRSVDAAPEELLSRSCEHLAFIEPNRWDALVAQLKEKHKGFGRKSKQNTKRSTWPGQHLRCGVCGRLLYFGAHGQIQHLACSGSRLYRCWNAVGVGGPLAARILTTAIFERIAELPEFDDEFKSLVTDEVAKLQSTNEQNQISLKKSLEKISREIGNIVTEMKEGRSTPSLREELVRLESEKSDLNRQLTAITRTRQPSIQIPSVAELKAIAQDSFEGLAADSPEFARLMKRLVSDIHVFPFRLLDDGRLVLRGQFTLNLLAFAPQLSQSPAVIAKLQRECIVDLFESPQRELFRERVMEARATGRTEKQAAELCGITITAAQRAANLDRLMKKLGVTDPYIPVKEPPADYRMLRRYKRERYRFEPLPGYPREWPVTT